MNLQEQLDNNQTIEAKVTEVVKGGLVVDTKEICTGLINFYRFH